MHSNLITCKSVWYYSAIDEELFFEWLKKILSIVKVDGIGDELYLHINGSEIPEDDLRELLALLYRYNIDMRQLAKFMTERNKSWFYDNKKAFWHRRVFGAR